MNKYLKILMLSGGLVSAISATAIDMDKTPHNDLGGIYEQVEKMQATLPRLSRINYSLNIDLDNALDGYKNDNNITTNQNLINENDSIVNQESGESDFENLVIDNNTKSAQIGENSQNISDEHNVSFSATDNNGEQTVLNNEETLNYLNETLNQTNIEYEQLKTTLSQAIKETMDYLDAYKNGETILTNEQKIYIKEHTNSIKFLAETLEDLSEDVLCCIDGCDNCEENDFDETASQYLTTISKLEERIHALNGAIASLQFVHNIGNPYFFAGHMSPNYIKYGYGDNSENNEQANTENDKELSNENINDANNESDSVEVNENTNTDSSVQNKEPTQDSVSAEDNNTSANITNDVDKPTTFGLKSNIDTYAPTRRNIDTFFNTALYNNEYMNGNTYGYGAPYGYGGGYGIPYAYGAGYGNPYGAGMGLNSNLVNRENLENHNCENCNLNANIQQTDETESENVQKPKKLRTKRAKNIDTYTETSIKSNINTMGESRISKFFKDKFNNLRSKVRNKKEGLPYPTENNNGAMQPNAIEEQNILNPNNEITIESIENVVNNTNQETASDTNNISPTLNIEISNQLEQEENIKAKN